MSHLPLSIKTLLFGVLVTVAMWLALDHYQSQRLGAVLDHSVRDRLQDELTLARTSLHEHILDQMELTAIIARSPAFQRHAREHLAAPKRRLEVYSEAPDHWGVPAPLWSSYLKPDFIVLLDGAYRPVERLRFKAAGGMRLPRIEPLTIELAEDDILVTSQALPGNEGYLVLLSLLGDRFLRDSQKYLLLKDRVLALWDAGSGRLLGATARVTPPVLASDYTRGGSSYFDYGSSEIRLELDIYAPKRVARAMIDDILAFTGRQRLYAFVLLTLGFLAFVQYYASAISRLRKQVTEFASRLFDFKPSSRAHELDEIKYLETTFNDFSQQLLAQSEIERRRQRVEQDENKIQILYRLTEALDIGLLTLEDGRPSPANHVMKAFVRACGDLMTLDYDQEVGGRRVAMQCDDGQRLFDIRRIELNERLAAVLVQDVTLLAEKTRKLQALAEQDMLTGLPNRFVLERTLERLIDDADGEGGEHLLMFLDLDRFKAINDYCGHDAGDRVLKQLGEVFRRHVRRSDLVARLGGDEFGIVLRNTSEAKAQGIVEDIVEDVLAYRFQWNKQTFSLGVSVGIVSFGPESGSVRSILSAADSACYTAKEEGGNRYHFYREGQDDAVAAVDPGDGWARRIERGLAGDRFVLGVQAFVPLADGQRQGMRYRVLLCLRNDDGSLIPPSAFLATAERHNLVERLDLLLVEKLLAWSSRRAPQAEVSFWIHVSGKNLANERFRGRLEALLQQASLTPASLCFVISEEAAIRDMEATSQFERFVHGLGCELAIDDFGSSMSPYTYLRQLRVDALKIDDLFTKGLLEHPRDCAFVRSMVELGHALGVEVVAGCGQDPRLRELLGQAGVDCILDQSSDSGTPIETLEGAGSGTI